MKTYLRTAFVILLIAVMPSFQLIKTSLHITVRDETGNIVSGASVRLFEKEEDYTKEENSVAEGTTDAKGILKLKDVKPRSYFVIVQKDDKDNSGGGEKIAKLDEQKVNKVTIIIQ